MKKILSPINGWQFFVTVFITKLFTTTYPLFVQVAIFLQINFILNNPLITVFIWLILPVFIILFACYKRLLDIYDNKKRAVGVTLFVVVSWLIAFFVLMKPIIDFAWTNIGYDIDDLLQLQATATNQFCYHIICTLFFIYLVFTESKKQANKLTVKIIVKRIVLLILLTSFIVYTRSKITSSFIFLPANDFKMHQTIDLGDTVLSYKHFKYESLKRFDVVTVYDEDFQMYNTSIRIIGLPNEKIEIKNNEIYADDKLIEDKYGYYAKKLTPVNINKTITLDDNSYFLMGDNRYWQKGGKYLSKNKKTGEEVWRNIDDEIGFVVSKDKITGKIIAINYKDYSKDKKYKSNIKRDKTGIMMLTKGKTLEPNPSELSIDLFGENIKE